MFAFTIWYTYYYCFGVFFFLQILVRSYWLCMHTLFALSIVWVPVVLVEQYHCRCSRSSMSLILQQTMKKKKTTVDRYLLTTHNKYSDRPSSNIIPWLFYSGVECAWQFLFFLLLHLSLSHFLVFQAICAWMVTWKCNAIGAYVIYCSEFKIVSILYFFFIFVLFF